MKERIFFVIAALVIAFLFAFREIEFKKNNQLLNAYESKAKSNILRCSPDWSQLNTWMEESDIPPIPGAGTHKWKITTGSDSAQFYFNQGINMYYSFHIIESMASFKKAAGFDPDCAMLEWAKALAYGPNINDIGYAASPDALTAMERARELSGGQTTKKEKLLIKAQAARYSADSTESREKLNQVYVDEMKSVYDEFPTDPDVAALYADALMLQHPWNLWNTDGTPKSWTPRIREVLEKLLAKTPNHPGANHYYIHVMEASPFASKALPSADRLGKITPGLSHTVHMPSHIYLRTGNYAKGVSVNLSAVESYKKSLQIYAPSSGAAFLYIIHNLHMQTNNAMMGGRSALAIQSALETMDNISDGDLAAGGAVGNYMQYVHMTPLLVDIRFGRWNEILSRNQPDPSHAYSTVLYHFGRGMAFAHKQDLNAANEELDRLRERMKDSTLYIPLSPFSAAIEGARVAEELLLGTIDEQRKSYDAAIQHFRNADSIETHMVYNEPRDWILSPKHYLGNAYLKAGKGKEAEAVFLKDLQYNNENGWALFGLYKALMIQKKSPAADKALVRFRKAFSNADIRLSSPVL